MQVSYNLWLTFCVSQLFKAFCGKIILVVCLYLDDFVYTRNDASLYEKFKAIHGAGIWYDGSLLPWCINFSEEPVICLIKILFYIFDVKCHLLRDLLRCVYKYCNLCTPHARHCWWDEIMNPFSGHLNQAVLIIFLFDVGRRLRRRNIRLGWIYSSWEGHRLGHGKCLVERDTSM